MLADSIINKRFLALMNRFVLHGTSRTRGGLRHPLGCEQPVEPCNHGFLSYLLANHHQSILCENQFARGAFLAMIVPILLQSS